MKKTILVVDDNEGLRHNYLFMIQRAGYEALGAHNGIEALQIMQKQRPDLVITDIMMPDMNGLELLQSIRSSRAGSELMIPVILLTSKSLPADIRQGMALGADDYLIKPVDSKELLRVIETRLNHYEHQQQMLVRYTNNVQLHLTTILPHELRTPLSGILGAATLIQQEITTLSKEEILELNECIVSSARRLTRMTENFLLYGQIRALIEKPNFNPIVPEQPAQNLELLIRDVIGSVAEYSLRQKGCSSTVHEQTLSISAVHFQKIMYELCLNALKFSPAGTAISITSELRQGMYVVSMTDKGSGLTQEQIEQIQQPFTTFVQFDRQRLEQQGTGLGLALVRSILTLYGGTFEIHSEPGVQTTVSVALPIIPI